MNPFDALSDYPILHIMSFLPVKDLLNLSEVNHKFKRIITTSKETREKIRLVVDFKNYNNLDDVIETAKNRQFTALKLGTRSRRPVKLGSLLEVLRGSVEDLVIERNQFGENNFRNIIQMFLPKLKSCTLIDVLVKESKNTKEAFSRNSNKYSLEALKFRDTSGKVLTFFACCSQLKTFENRGPIRQAIDADYLNNFVAVQSHLEKLVFHGSRLAYNRLTCFKLEEFDVSCEGDEDRAAEFLMKLKSLETLTLTIGRQFPRCLMQAICDSPELKSLGLTATCSFPGNVFHPLEGLENHTIKKLFINHGIGITGQMLQPTVVPRSRIYQIRFGR